MGQRRGKLVSEDLSMGDGLRNLCRDFGKCLLSCPHSVIVSQVSTLMICKDV